MMKVFLNIHVNPIPIIETENLGNGAELTEFMALRFLVI